METAMEKRSNLVMPTIGYELDREEMSYVDGGGMIKINLQLSLGGIVASFGVGFTTGFIVSFAATFLAKRIPTWVGKLIGALIGATVGAFVSSKINSKTGVLSIPIIFWFPFISHESTYDIGDKAFDLISGALGGGIGGGMGGALAGSICGAMA